VKLSETRGSVEAPEQEKKFGSRKKAREYQTSSESTEEGGGVYRCSTTNSSSWREISREKRKERGEETLGLL
jgi:hypothetical protein